MPGTSAGEELFNECRRLYENDKLFQAVRAERALAKLDPAVHEAKNEYLQRVRASGDEAEAVRMSASDVAMRSAYDASYFI